MKLSQCLLLVGLAISCSASPYKSTKPSIRLNPECAKGVEFWCQDISSAKKCNAVDFCISAVWESHLSAKDSNAICDDCKEWVGQARTFIEKKETSDEIIKSLKFTCDLIPDKSLEETCENLVDENLPEILKMLESAMDPDVICSKLSLCNNKKFDKFLGKKTEEKLLPFTCGQCHHIGSIIEEKINEFDADEVLEKLLGVCGELSSFSDSCATIVMKNFDEISSALKRNLHKKNLCSLSGACTSHQFEGIVEISPAPTADPNIPCQLCEQMMLHLRELLIINTSDVEFKNMMIGFCHQMGKFSDECTSITDEYYEKIYKFLQDNLSANKTCTAIGICKGISGSELAMPSMPLVSSDLYPTPADPAMIEVHMVFHESSALALVNDGAWCTTCEYVVHFIQDSLAKPSVDDDLENVMKNACKVLPNRIKDDCVAFVDLYGDAMMSLWGQNMDARIICPEIRMCPPNLSLKVLQETEVEEKPTCPFCLMALQEVSDYVQSNRTKASIENALSKLCNHLNEKLLSQCTEFVKDYTNEVVDMLVADFTPQDACSFLSLCTDKEVIKKEVKIVRIEGGFGGLKGFEEPQKDAGDLRASLGHSRTYGKSFKAFETSRDSGETLKDPQETSKTLDNPQCLLCKEIVKIVEERVIDKKSKEEIRRQLEKSCDKLKKFKKQCKHFVDKYSDKMVDLIERELGPEEVCKELIFCVMDGNAESQDYDSGLEVLGMAVKKDSGDSEQDSDEIFGKSRESSEESSEKSPGFFKNSQDSLETIKDKPGCVICEFIMSKLQDELNDKSTDKEIKDALEKVCSKLPSSVSNSCSKFVESYFNLLVAMLEMQKPSEVCGMMKLCVGDVGVGEEDLEDLKMIVELQDNVYECAVCKGVVESFNDIVTNPRTDTDLENFEEKICEVFKGNFKEKCFSIAKEYGLLMLTLLKNKTDTDNVCFELNLCSEFNIDISE